MARKKDEEEAPRKVSEDVGRALRSLRDSFNKDRGAEDRIAWNLDTDADNPTDVKEFLSTGSTLLDYVISNRRDGGVPVGKITEIQGEEASGKSLLACQLIASAQRKGGVCVYIDTENAYNPDFAARLGVDNSKVLYLQPGTIEHCFEAVEKCIVYVKQKDIQGPFLIVWDSVAATPPQAEIEGDYDPNSRIGLMAKALAKGMRKLTNTIGRERVTMVFTNQLKMRPGVMYGDPFITPGGKAIPYHASVRVRLTGSKKLKDPKSGDIYAINTAGKVVKTRLGPPHRRCDFQIHFASGIDDEGSIRDYLHERKVISKAGGYMIIEKAPTEDGGIEPELKFREAAWRELLSTRPKLRQWVLDRVEELMVVKYGSKPTEVDPDAPPIEEAFDDE